MAKIPKNQNTSKTTEDLHKGYNEENPAQPEGAFKTTEMEKAPRPVKKSPRKNKKTV